MTCDLKATLGKIAAKRHHIALDCKLFRKRLFFIYERHKIALCPYSPLNKDCWSRLPATTVSGVSIDGDMWTDGSIVLRTSRKRKDTEVIISFSGDVNGLFERGKKATALYLFCSLDLGRKLFVLVCVKKEFKVISLAYADLALWVARSLKNLTFHFAKNGKGCVLSGESTGQVAYISEIIVPDFVKHQLKRVMEAVYAVRRRRPKSVENWSMCSGKRKRLPVFSDILQEGFHF